MLLMFMAANRLPQPRLFSWASLSVRAVGTKTAVRVVVEQHYLHRKPPISHAFGLFYDGQLEGVLTVGCPPSHALRKSACPEDPLKVWELNRLWVSDAMPRNTESWFVARVLRQLPPMILVSYADTSVGHAGYIYRASNWFYSGWTDMDRKTPRFDYIPTHGGHSREAFRSGYVGKVRREPKHKYWIVTGNKKDRRELAKLCGWPQMSWSENPLTRPNHWSI